MAQFKPVGVTHVGQGVAPSEAFKVVVNREGEMVGTADVCGEEDGIDPDEATALPEPLAIPPDADMADSNELA